MTTSVITGVYVGVLVVALLQYLRVRDRRLLPLLVLFALLSAANMRGLSEYWAKIWHLGAGAAGFVVVLLACPRPPARPH
jgi:hypothetical protein